MNKPAESDAVAEPAEVVFVRRASLRAARRINDFNVQSALLARQGKLQTAEAEIKDIAAIIEEEMRRK